MRASAIAICFALMLAGCGGWQQQMDMAMERQQAARMQEFERVVETECKGQGAQPGTDFYNLCRTRVAERMAAAEADLDRRRMGTVR
jgi:hypothetical protein